MTRSALASIALFVIPTLLLGCGKKEEEPLGNDPGPDLDAGVQPDGPPPKRIVERRNPFGRTDISDNLLADGDFEITGRSGQPAWYAFDRSGQAILNYQTGGRCFSGVRCASLVEGEALLGFIASPKTGGMSVSIMIKPASGQCGDATVSVTDLDDTDRTTDLSAETETADSSGWCRFSGITPNHAGGAPALRVGAKAPLLVDDGIVVPAAAGQLVTFSHTVPSSMHTIAQIRFEAEWIRSHRHYGRPPTFGAEGPPPRIRLER